MDKPHGKGPGAPKGQRQGSTQVCGTEGLALHHSILYFQALLAECYDKHIVIASEHQLCSDHRGAWNKQQKIFWSQRLGIANIQKHKLYSMYTRLLHTEQISIN